MYHRWGVLDVVIDGVVSECENENYDCYSRMEYCSLPWNYMLSLTIIYHSLYFLRYNGCSILTQHADDQDACQIYVVLAAHYHTSVTSDFTCDDLLE
jgi:hypothetical protein